MAKKKTAKKAGKKTAEAAGARAEFLALTRALREGAGDGMGVELSLDWIVKRAERASELYIMTGYWDHPWVEVLASRVKCNVHVFVDEGQYSAAEVKRMRKEDTQLGPPLADNLTVRTVIAGALFHAKVYQFRSNDGASETWIGGVNATRQGIEGNGDLLARMDSGAERAVAEMIDRLRLPKHSKEPAVGGPRYPTLAHLLMTGQLWNKREPAKRPLTMALNEKLHGVVVPNDAGAGSAAPFGIELEDLKPRISLERLLVSSPDGKLLRDAIAKARKSRAGGKHVRPKAIDTWWGWWATRAQSERIASAPSGRDQATAAWESVRDELEKYWKLGQNEQAEAINRVTDALKQAGFGEPKKQAILEAWKKTIERTLTVLEDPRSIRRITTEWQQADVPDLTADHLTEDREVFEIEWICGALAALIAPQERRRAAEKCVRDLWSALELDENELQQAADQWRDGNDDVVTDVRGKIAEALRKKPLDRSPWEQDLDASALDAFNRIMHRLGLSSGDDEAVTRLLEHAQVSLDRGPEEYRESVCDLLEDGLDPSLDGAVAPRLEGGEDVRRWTAWRGWVWWRGVPIFFPRTDAWRHIRSESLAEGCWKQDLVKLLRQFVREHDVKGADQLRKVKADECGKLVLAPEHQPYFTIWFEPCCCGFELEASDDGWRCIRSHNRGCPTVLLDEDAEEAEDDEDED